MVCCFIEVNKDIVCRRRFCVLNYWEVEEFEEEEVWFGNMGFISYIKERRFSGVVLMWII